jgi:hypothetical protein
MTATGEIAVAVDIWHGKHPSSLLWVGGHDDHEPVELLRSSRDETQVTKMDGIE